MSNVEYIKKVQRATEMARKAHESRERISSEFCWPSFDPVGDFDSTSSYGQLQIAVWMEMLEELSGEIKTPLKEKVPLQYYSINPECSSDSAFFEDCLCWFDEGTGPRPEPFPGDRKTRWRIKGTNKIIEPYGESGVY